MENVHDRLIRYLDDAWGLEKSNVKALDDVIEKSDDPDARMLAERNRQVVHDMEEALEARIRALGEEPSGGRGTLGTIAGKVGDALHGARDDFDEATQTLMKEFGSESFKVGVYCSLEAFAHRIGDGETVNLARQHMQRARECVENVWKVLPQVAGRAVDGTEGTFSGATAEPGRATRTDTAGLTSTYETVGGAGPFGAGTPVPGSMPNDLGPLASGRGVLYNTQEFGAGREAGTRRSSAEQLSTVKLADVMTPHVEVVAPDASLHEAAQKMRSLDVGPLPVCDRDKVVGMVTDRDITVRAVADGRDPKNTRVRDVMTTDVVYCYEDDPLTRCVEIMETKQIRRILVMGRDNHLRGIISLGDIATRMGPESKTLSGEVLEQVSEPSRPRTAGVR